jgi:hypothetical protein
VQSSVDGVTHAVCVDGRIAWHCSYAYQTRPGELLNPRSMRPKPDPIGLADLDVLSSFIKAASFTGPVSFDYRRRGDGRLAILEINPRFGGSLIRKSDRSDFASAVETILANARWYG